MPPTSPSIDCEIDCDSLFGLPEILTYLLTYLPTYCACTVVLGRGCCMLLLVLMYHESPLPVDSEVRGESPTGSEHARGFLTDRRRHSNDI